MTVKQTISLCMITKDEETCLSDCIASVKHLIDEIIVVDTGSTDKTVEVAKAHGAQVYMFNWAQDFGAARNYGLDKAAGDWILVLDADEMLETVAVEKVEKLLNDESKEGYYLPVYSFVGNGERMFTDSVVRLFRNNPKYRFESVIHEQVTGSIKRLNKEGLAYCELTILHYGYLDQRIKTKNKKIRNISIIEKALENNSDNAFLIYSLSIEYLQCGDIAKGEYYLESALSLLNGSEGYFRHVIIALALSYYAQGKYEKFKTLISKAVLVLVDEPTITFLNGVLFLKEGKYFEARDALYHALDGADEVISLQYVYALLADINSFCGEYEKAKEHYQKAFKLAPSGLYPFLQILGLKQRDQVSLKWDDLSNLLTAKEYNVYIKRLELMEEYETALVMGLLNMLYEINKGEMNLYKALLVYEHILIKCYASDFEKKLAHEYLLLGLNEIKIIWAFKKDINISNKMVSIPDLKSLIIDSLELVIKGLCPFWTPNPSLVLERAVIK